MEPLDGHEISVKRGPGWVPVGESEFLPKTFMVTIRDLKLPGLVVDVEVETQVTGEARARAVRIASETDDPVTSDTLRKIPVARLLSAGCAAAMEKLEEDDQGRLVLSPMRYRDVVAFRDSFRGARRPRQGTKVTEDDLQAVAGIYLAAEAAGASGFTAVQKELYASKSTAARWIAQARERGLLPARGTLPPSKEEPDA